MTLKEFLFSNKYNSLKWRISYFFKYKIPFSKGWNEYHNPYFPWWKARKHFKKPKWRLVIHGKIGWFFGLPCRHDYYNRILDIHTSSLGWKDKYNSPRHEWDPYIAITLFRKWQLCWVFTYHRKGDINGSTRNLATWEAMLDYLYYKVPIDKVANNHVWGYKDDEIRINNNIK